ncbi:MAG TPA: hypothetical protein DEE98_03310 [Elusimicrobia bacterium]|nr:MAG: hypothetical protein A2278_08125 [Elusimicrobia bacterium RIFOXYA12_FULL_49_49]OGS10315.1 MAG: hypothetical protein A2386_04185 [Elusimicrobia bacterium RIFOXYB1_FULL_48_9]OGS15969.1 MAG: hypothetical protein A2251_02140 [Elusimicrobia bacterium RIFOXYA2_FULL_47_53]OGS26351.1 MAG: hypothetical protein A2339_03125 [Elusimicrobia bacterium RIFOXYB12_FULL_50_12]OGS29137.1 MAG: hypothetical protein A2323_04680 [Elusimicrobia bacterium RIFOXYB2_FULL_46_23]HBU69393.1 hypothetical protein [El
MKPKVFCLITSLNTGGTEKFLVTLLETLKNDYDFSVGYLKEKGYFGAYLEQKGFKVSKFSQVLLPLRLKQLKPAIVHTFLYRANIVGRIAAKIAGVPAVISTQQAIDAWKNPVHTAADSLSSVFCDLIVANSKATKDILSSREGINPDKIEVVYNGINFGAFKPQKDRTEVRKALSLELDDTVVACVSRLHEEKGADLLPLIAEKVKNAVFIVAGEGPAREGMETRIKSLGLENRFKLLGERHDISDLLGASDIFLLPSREESFPQGILEAMASSLPVVASDVGGVSELVEDKRTGFLVEPLSVSGFAESLNYLIEHKGYSQNMGAQGREKSAGFTEEAMTANINILYQNILKEKSCI